MLKGKEMTAIVDDIASRIGRNANIGGETLTKAGFGNVKITVHLTVETKDKAKGSSKLVRESSFSDYDYAAQGGSDGTDSNGTTNGAANGATNANPNPGGAMTGTVGSGGRTYPYGSGGGQNRGW